MTEYKASDEKEVQRINRLQRKFFQELVHLFDPPLPEGVPERLEKIVAAGDITRGDAVLDLGTGTGILVPIIKKYEPEKIYACDLTLAMLLRLKEQYPYTETIQADARNLPLPDACMDVIFMNACYPNIVDKQSTFENISRMMKTGGRLIISHPMGKSFISLIRDKAPFPLDDFPDRTRAKKLLEPFDFRIMEFVDEPRLYIMKAIKQ